MPESEPAIPSDKAILAQLGSAVLLCWDELASESQVKILDQTDDMIGIPPMPGVRNQIIRLLLRHGKM
jgi:hypothetical protein